MHAVDVLQHPSAHVRYIIDPREEIEGFADRHELIEHRRLGSDLLFPDGTLLVGFHDGRDDLLDALVQQLHLGDTRAHDVCVGLAEAVRVRLEVLVDTPDEHHVRLILADRLHEALQNVLGVVGLFQGETELVKEDREALEPVLELTASDELSDDRNEIPGLALELDPSHHLPEGEPELLQGMRVVLLQRSTQLIDRGGRGYRGKRLGEILVEVADAALVSLFLPRCKLAVRLVELSFHLGIQPLGRAGLKHGFHHDVFEALAGVVVTDRHQVLPVFSDVPQVPGGLSIKLAVILIESGDCRIAA